MIVVLLVSRTSCETTISCAPVSPEPTARQLLLILLLCSCVCISVLRLYSCSRGLFCDKATVHVHVHAAGSCARCGGNIPFPEQQHTRCGINNHFPSSEIRVQAVLNIEGLPGTRYQVSYQIVLCSWVCVALTALRVWSSIHCLYNRSIARLICSTEVRHAQTTKRPNEHNNNKQQPTGV